MIITVILSVLLVLTACGYAFNNKQKVRTKLLDMRTRMDEMGFDGFARIGDGLPLIFGIAGITGVFVSIIYLLLGFLGGCVPLAIVLIIVQWCTIVKNMKLMDEVLDEQE